MSIDVAVTVTAGRLRYETHAASLIVRRGVLPLLDHVDYRLPRGVRFEAAPGDELLVDLDGGDGTERVFTGTVTSTSHTLHGARLLGHNGGRALAHHRPSASLEQIEVGDVVSQLCDDIGVDVDAPGGPTLARYVAVARSTALDEVTRLLHLAAAFAAFDGDGKLVARVSEPHHERALLFGREIVSLDATGAAPPGPTRTVAGEGAGGADSDTALWPTADFSAGRHPFPGPGVRTRIAHEIRTTNDAQSAATAWSSRAAAESTPVCLRCWLQPTIAPGDRLQLVDVPEDLGLGDVRVRQVTHTVDPEHGAHTEIRGHDESAGEGLLGAALDLVGGLL